MRREARVTAESIFDKQTACGQSVMDAMSKGNTSFEVREDGLGWKEGRVKVVGLRSPSDPAKALRWNSSMLRLSPLCGKWFPRGVFRFKTWEEERLWTKDQIKRASLRLK